MTKSTVTTKISAAFLATVLVAGIIAISSPSFMTGAQAQEYYGMDRDYKKSDKKDVNVKNIKCNNVNVNVNGVELNISSVPFLSGLLGSEAQADEGERGANSYGSSGGSYGDKRSGSGGDFKFVCINNNNNTVVGVADGDDNGNGNGNGNGDEPETCLECFDVLSVELRAAIDEFLDEQGLIPLSTGIGGISIPANVDDIEGLCAFLDLLRATLGPLTLTEAQIDAFISGFIGQLEDPIVDAEAQLDALILCLIDVGVLVEAEVNGS